MLTYTSKRIETEKNHHWGMTSAPISDKNRKRMMKICKSLKNGDWIWVVGEGYELPTKFVGLDGIKVKISHGPYGDTEIYYYQVLRKVNQTDVDELQEEIENTLGGYLVNTKINL